MDKVYFAASNMFALHAPSDKFVTWSGTEWIFDEIRWGNYCAELEDRGVNMMRWLGWNSWFDWFDKGLKENLTPFLRNPGGLYDLSKRNPDYWRLAERMIEIMNYPSQKPGIKAPGAECLIDLAYEYRGDDDDIENSPWRRNLQGIKSLYDPKAWPYFERYALEWIALSRVRKIKIGMGNEGTVDALPFYYRLLDLLDSAREWPFSWGICAKVPAVDGFGDTFKYLPKYIKDHGLFLWHPLRKDPLEKWDLSVFRPVHGCSMEKNRKGVDVFRLALSYWLGHSIRYFLRDDGDMDENGKPGVALWKAAIKDLFTKKGTAAVTKHYNGIEWPNVGIEHLPDDELWDKSRVEQLGVFDAMGAALEVYVGRLENRGKWKDVWVPSVPPIPVPGPSDPPPAHEDCSLWYHLRRGNFKAAWAHLLGRHS